MVRTAGVHAGRGDCNRAVEVCVSGFGTQIEIAGETIRGSGSNGSPPTAGRSVGGRSRVQAAGESETPKKRDVTRMLYSGYGREASKRKRKTQQQCTKTRADDVFAVTEEEREWNGRRFKFVRLVRRVEASRGKRLGGRGGKERDQQRAKAKLGEGGGEETGGQAQASEEGPSGSGQWAGK